MLDEVAGANLYITCLLAGQRATVEVYDDNRQSLGSGTRLTASCQYAGLFTPFCAPFTPSATIVPPMGDGA